MACAPAKSDIPNPKSETIGEFKAELAQTRTPSRPLLDSGFPCSAIRICFGVRSSEFGFTARSRAFTLPDFLVVLAILMMLIAVAVPPVIKNRARTRQALCESNLKEITRAVLLYADDAKGTLPLLDPSPPTGVWWWYKELVKGQLGMTGPSSRGDKLFTCPEDRGYDEPRPFYSSPKFDYGSYVFNGVNLPGVPNLAGKKVASIKEPAQTLLMMEWTAHAPLSWHKSRTGSKNHPFYNDAENVVGFVDGHVGFIKIYYDGINAAYTRDPIPGYNYKYSGE